MAEIKEAFEQWTCAPESGRRMENFSAEKKIYFLRHCESEWSHSKLYQGQSDPPLSGVGIARAELVAANIAPLLGKESVVISSPLARARMTASPIAARAKATLTIDPLLAELNYGRWEGLNQLEIKAAWPEILRNWKRRPDKVEFPDGESLHDLQRRVREFLAAAAQKNGTILAVTHAGVIRVAFLEAMGLPLTRFRTIRPEHGGMVGFIRDKGKLRTMEQLPLVDHEVADGPCDSTHTQESSLPASSRQSEEQIS